MNMKLGITYLMKNKKETAETYIELPVMEELEELAHGEKCGVGLTILTRIISDLCTLQGYFFDGIETIEVVEK